MFFAGSILLLEGIMRVYFKESQAGEKIFLSSFFASNKPVYIARLWNTRFMRKKFGIAKKF